MAPSQESRSHPPFTNHAMDEANEDLLPNLEFDDARPAPLLVSLAPISSPMPLRSGSASARRRRLYTSFVEPIRPVLWSGQPMAWISLLGHIVNAEEASSARTIGGGLSAEEAVAWELFSPIQRFLIVAVIGVAVAESKKNQHIRQLKKSVELRDQVLSSMQQKLDNLCEQLNNSKEQSATAIKSFTKDGELPSNENLGSEKMKVVDCGCWHCDQHSDFFNELVGSSLMLRRASTANEVLFQYKTPFSNEEQEERRMSDLSDWASSVTSTADIQLNTLAAEQDIYNIKRECEEKDITIKELTTLLNSSEFANSKRVAELEDIIRRKNSTITKLKKDLVVLEQKVVQLSRLRRDSFSAGDSNGVRLPQMRDNLVYDMESTTSSSSSDSDATTPVNVTQDSAAKVDHIILNQSSVAAVNEKSTPTKAFSSSRRAIEQHSKSQSVTPFVEISTNRKSDTAYSSSQNRLSAPGDLKKSRRRSLSGSKSGTAQKRWV